MIKKVHLEECALTRFNADPTKGTVTNPYTQTEKATFPEDMWPGGYVEGMGYITSYNPWGSDSSNPFGSGEDEQFYANLNSILSSLPQELTSLYTTGTIDIIPDDTIPTAGRYDPATKKIHIRRDRVTTKVIRHELIHAWEDQQEYLDNESKANNEYETYVMNDVVSVHTNAGFSSIPLGSASKANYEQFIMDCYTTNYPTSFRKSYFLSNANNFFDAFREAMPNYKYNPNYQWHWEELLELFGIE